MSDPTATTTASTAAPPPPQKPILARVGDTLAGALHAAGNVVDRIGEDVAADLAPVAKFAEADLVQVARDAFQAAAQQVAAYGQRNAPELSSKSAMAIVAFLQTLAPGLAVESAALEPFIASECAKMFAVLDGELQTLATTQAVTVVAQATAPKATT